MNSSLIYIQSSPLFLQLICCLFGLVMGSFLNVVIYRLPLMLESQWALDLALLRDEPLQSESIEPYNLAIPRSACPHCHHQIRWYENVPVLSYLFLRGKCSNCSSPISCRYPLVEAFVGLLYALAGAHFGVTWNLGLSMALIAMLVALAFIDIDHLLLPDAMTLPLMWIGLLVSSIYPIAGFTSLEHSVWGAAIGYGLFWAINYYYETFRGKTALGGGDAKLMAALGAWFGFNALILQIIPVAATIALIWSGFMILRAKATKDTPLPFGPSICISGGLMCFFGYFLGFLYP